MSRPSQPELKSKLGVPLDAQADKQNLWTAKSSYMFKVVDQFQAF